MTNPKPNQKPIIWTISGSDCSGGAGIAADIKTGHALCVEICHLITANTIQNSTQLMSVNAISVELLQQQVEILADDKPPIAIKIGLLANTEQVHWLAQTLVQLKQLNPLLITVYDPVGQASVGGSFSSLTVADLTPLLMLIDIITPNCLEAKSLASVKGEGEGEGEANIEKLAHTIHRNFAISSVIIKGGHSDDKAQCLDFCYHQLNHLKQDNQDKNKTAICYQLSSPRINTNYSHGGGCSFATALSAFLAQGYLVRDAFTLTKAFINQGLTATKTSSLARKHSYYGAFEQVSLPLNSESFPKVVNQLNKPRLNISAFNSLNLQGKKLGLYPVIDSLYWLERLLPLGLEIIQLRIKNLPQDELEQVLIKAIELAKNYNTRLFINDYWQLAIKHGAYGVHIGQEDLADVDLVEVQHAGLRLGISTHGCYEFLLAQQLAPSYLAVGAIFPTKTKDMTGQIQGIENLAQVLTIRTSASKEVFPPRLRNHGDDDEHTNRGDDDEHAHHGDDTNQARDRDENSTIPVVAIGGINLERAPQVLATGVDSIAVVTAITEAMNPEKVITQLVAYTHDIPRCEFQDD